MSNDEPKNESLISEFAGHVHRNGILAASRTFLRRFLMWVRWYWLTKCWHMDIHPTAQISLKAKLDRTNPRGIHIGEGSYVVFGAVILSHDYIRGIHDAHTRIGKRCLIGANSFIMPGVIIGDDCIIGAMTVVTKDVPAGSLVVGNPGTIIKSGVTLDDWKK